MYIYYHCNHQYISWYHVRTLVLFYLYLSACVCMCLLPACMFVCTCVLCMFVCACACVEGEGVGGCGCDVGVCLCDVCLHFEVHYSLAPLSLEIHSLATSCRNPVHSERPTAADILGDFCKSERVLLGWRVEDTVPLLSRTLGAPLSEGETLHRDLQNKYKGH